MLTKFMIFFFAVSASAQASPTPSPRSITSIHIYASNCELTRGSIEGTRVTGVVAGQPVVLHNFQEKYPIEPGEYPVKLIRENKPHGAELDQRYAITLPDGKEVSFYLEAICDRDAAVCYGVSVK